MKVEIIGLSGISEIRRGDDLAGISLEAVERVGLTFEDDDILVVTSKIISKSEGRVVDLSEIEVTDRARELSEMTGKDVRIVQMVLDEAEEIIRIGKDFIITETKDGVVCANAGIDESNVERGRAILLPVSMQESARSLRREIEKRTEKHLAVLVSDSIGRAFRDGVVGTCVGVSGLTPVLDRRGEVDRFKKISRITKVGIADEICSAANIVMGEFREGIPMVLVRGLTVDGCEADVGDMVFDKSDDVFR
ncbi:MAG: coenzyme F420-0:L-glutamate ligase [Halobacteriota archaeon]|nr:coenzyme F420-0:L-glutamate ligase [Halobacteriota archaeon]